VNFLFGDRSEGLLANLHPALVGVLRLALSYDEMDFTVLETLRTMTQEVANVAAGRSQTLNSKHLPGKDGKARAADCAPWPIEWKDIERFSKLNDLIQRAAKELNVKVVWGGSWKTLQDYDHWELA
jgi:peptidoglycan LD-endopeptidase CwlK